MCYSDAGNHMMSYVRIFIRLIFVFTQYNIVLFDFPFGEHFWSNI